MYERPTSNQQARRTGWGGKGNMRTSEGGNRPRRTMFFTPLVSRYVQGNVGRLSEVWYKRPWLKMKS